MTNNLFLQVHTNIRTILLIDCKQMLGNMINHKQSNIHARAAGGCIEPLTHDDMPTFPWKGKRFSDQIMMAPKQTPVLLMI